MIVECDRWLPAPMDLEIVDVWPPGRLGDVEKAAYDRLARAGRIKPKGVTRDAAGRMIVRYLADIPKAWIRAELKAAKLEGEQMEVRL